MGFLSFKQKAKPKTFTYVPQYYDERQERLDKLMKDFDADDEDSIEAMKARIKMGYDKTAVVYDKAQMGKRLRRKSNIRVLLIIAVLLFGILYILNMAPTS